MVGELIAGAAAGLTNPATVLIERVSDAVGGIARPRQIQRVAEAEAKAEAKKALILAQSEIDVTDLQRRAALRWMEEETKNQENIESITHQALPHLNDDAEPEKIEDDFLRNFFDKSRLVSDEQMQDVWSRILAGEANNPGTFSRKTVNIVADMDKDDAELFTTLCSFAWWYAGNTNPFVFVGDRFFGEIGITLMSLLELESLGLINTASTGFQTEQLPATLEADYFGKRLQLSLADTSQGNLPLGNVVLTPTGRQVGSVCKIKRVEGFFEYMRGKWEEDPNIESVSVPKAESESIVKVFPQQGEPEPETEEALLTGWLKEIDWQGWTAQLHEVGGGSVNLRFDPTQAEELSRLAGRHVEVRGSGRFNDQDEWISVRVEQIRDTQAWSQPFDLDAYLNDPEPKIFDPDELVRVDLTDEEREAFNRAIREGREA